MSDTDRLRRLFAEPGLAWVLDRWRDRLRSGRPLRGTIVRRDPTSEERRALDSLLGRSPGRTRALTLRLDDLAETLRRAELAENLEEAARAVLGDVPNLRARRRRRTALLRDLLEEARGRDPRPEIAAWTETRRTRVLLRRWGRDEQTARTLVEEALEVLRRLPRDDRPLVQELAVEVTGDAHALDPGRRLWTFVISAVAALGTGADWHDAAGWREIWDAVGVSTDDVSAPVLVLGLPGDDATLLGRHLELHRRAGQPCRVSLRHLAAGAPDFAGLRERGGLGVVSICENPSLLQAAADRLGDRCGPLVCLEGQPSTAARRLLDLLRVAGVPLRIHGDFDWAGLRIARLVVERHGPEPWRYGAEDYLAAPAGPPLDAGGPVDMPWDPGLATAMVDRGRAVHEEAQMERLLADLRLAPD